MPPYFLIFDSDRPRPIARYGIGHHANAEADRLKRTTGRAHYVREVSERDVTRPIGDGMLVYATQGVAL